MPISDGFGYRVAPCSGCSSYHEGIDMNPGAGSPIQAIADGVVREVGNPSGSLGVYAIIDHQIDGETVSSLYAHMAYGSLALRVGQTVKVRQLVGLVGSTGASTGAHLHLGISVNGTPVDPFAWLTQKVK
ncbi:M23 family metallopeptidase [Leifsonia shinshuensis]|uniref:M23 family metallopeptidase n=1 Tax=Leifsonia shinshuensis TaxID=150026 RepID=UPI0021562CB9|nr:M23 family metallopeptidase [Leifsonia shinshuensis]